MPLLLLQVSVVGVCWYSRGLRESAGACRCHCQPRCRRADCSL